MKMEAWHLDLVEDIAVVVSELDGVSGETDLGSLVLIEYSSCHGRPPSSGNCSPNQFRRRRLPRPLKLEPTDSIDTEQKTHIDYGPWHAPPGWAMVRCR
jgi:hypothetical protein